MHVLYFVSMCRTGHTGDLHQAIRELRQELRNLGQPLSHSEYLDLKTAEQEYPFSRRTLWNFISTGRLSAYRPIAKKVLLKRSDLNRLIEASRVRSNIAQLADETAREVLENG